MAEQAYTSEDFELAGSRLANSLSDFPDEPKDFQVIAAALLMAAAVMRPGVIEKAIARHGVSTVDGNEHCAAGIRIALLQDTGNG